MSKQKDLAVTQRIHLPEVSGACQLPGDKLLLVSDEFGVFIAQNAQKQLRSGGVKPASQPVELFTGENILFKDCEDASYDQAGGFLFLTTGHGRNRRGVLEKSRCQLARAKVTPENGDITDVQISDSLIWSILSNVPELASALLLPPSRGGLNIEGLAWDPARNHLLVGLRSPTFTQFEKRDTKMQEDAIILRIGNPHEIFETPGCPAELVIDKTTNKAYFTLSLNGHGIRGLAHDKKKTGFWILSGLSSDPNHKVRDIWGLWHWDGKHSVRQVVLPKEAQALHAPEAVCTVSVDGASCLLIVEDREAEDSTAIRKGTVDIDRLAKKNDGCPYMILPTKKLEFRRPPD